LESFSRDWVEITLIVWQFIMRSLAKAATLSESLNIISEWALPPISTSKPNPPNQVLLAVVIGETAMLYPRICEFQTIGLVLCKDGEEHYSRNDPGHSKPPKHWHNRPYLEERFVREEKEKLT
jgi:hypothetical protein